jgi:hypothetical protein
MQAMLFRITRSFPVLLTFFGLFALPQTAHMQTPDINSEIKTALAKIFDTTFFLRANIWVDFFAVAEIEMDPKSLKVIETYSR